MSYCKVFISQPMRGKTQEEILERRNRIIELIKETIDEPYILDSFLTGAKDVDPLVCLGHAITILSKADIVVFDADWHESRGCRIEHSISEEYDKKFYYVKEENDILQLIEIK